jgi:hypothetical protein
MRSNSVLVVFLLFPFLVACKPVMRLQKDQDRNVITYIEKIISKEEFKNYSADLEIKTSDNSTVRTAYAKIFIDRGSFIYLNSSLFGFELFRAEITPDSIKYINRIEKEYFFGSVQNCSRVIGFPVDYTLVESLLLYGMNPYGKSGKLLEKSISVSGDAIRIVNKSDNRIKVETWLNSSSYSLDSITVYDNFSGDKAVIKILGYRDKDSYPTELELNLPEDRSAVNKVDIKILNIEHNRLKSHAFEINNKYHEIVN